MLDRKMLDCSWAFNQVLSSAMCYVFDNDVFIKSYEVTKERPYLEEKVNGEETREIWFGIVDLKNPPLIGYSLDSIVEKARSIHINKNQDHV